jgi:hypothetical protein
MNALIHDPAELVFMPDASKASEALVAELDSASIVESVQGRELTLTLVLDRIIEFRPSSHWGINE